MDIVIESLASFSSTSRRGHWDADRYRVKIADDYSLFLLSQPRLISACSLNFNYCLDLSLRVCISFHWMFCQRKFNIGKNSLSQKINKRDKRKSMYHLAASATFRKRKKTGGQQDTCHERTPAYHRGCNLFDSLHLLSPPCIKVYRAWRKASYAAKGGFSWRLSFHALEGVPFSHWQYFYSNLHLTILKSCSRTFSIPGDYSPFPTSKMWVSDSPSASNSGLLVFDS